MDIKKSKLLSLVLRHKPEKIGITMDKNGWVDIDELLIKGDISLIELNSIVEFNDKKRFEFNSSKTKIRACQGHSLGIDLLLKSVKPPSVLYHGTNLEAFKIISKKGISKMRRDQVHLSTDIETAIMVANRRKSETILLVIDSGRMFLDGIEFYKSTNGVWLTDFVDSKYISGKV